MKHAARNGLLAKIHIAKKDMGLTDADYRAVLAARFGAASAGELTEKQLLTLLSHFEGLGWRPVARRKNDTHGRPRTLDRQDSNSRTAMLEKIEAMLAEKGRDENGHIPWSYAARILKRQCGVERLEFASCEQLKGVIAALYQDAKRNGRATE